MTKKGIVRITYRNDDHRQVHKMFNARASQDIEASNIKKCRDSLEFSYLDSLLIFLNDDVLSFVQVCLLFVSLIDSLSC